MSKYEVVRCHGPSYARHGRYSTDPIRHASEWYKVNCSSTFKNHNHLVLRPGLVITVVRFEFKPEVMADLKLFDASLIDQAVKDSLPENYIMRPLAHDDYSKGFFECLQSLTWTGNVSRERFEERFDWLRTKGVDWFYDVVIEHQNRIVGTGVLLVERKL